VPPLITFLLQRVRKRRDHRMPQEKPVEQRLRQGQTTPTPRLSPRAAGERRDHRMPQEKPVEQRLRQGQTTPAPRLTPRAAGDRAHGSPARTVPLPANDRVTKKSPLGTARDVRRGIAIMTLLGPCRAFDSPD
jgi:hypothetical protein